MGSGRSLNLVLFPRRLQLPLGIHIAILRLTSTPSGCNMAMLYNTARVHTMAMVQSYAIRNS
jgi:hypothetical protein